MRTFTVLAALILLVGCDNASSSKPAPFGVVFQSGHTAPMVEEPTAYFYYGFSETSHAKIRQAAMKSSE